MHPVVHVSVTSWPPNNEVTDDLAIHCGYRIRPRSAVIPNPVQIKIEIDFLLNLTWVASSSQWIGLCRTYNVERLLFSVGEAFGEA